MTGRTLTVSIGRRRVAWSIAWFGRAVRAGSTDRLVGGDAVVAVSRLLHAIQPNRCRLVIHIETPPVQVRRLSEMANLSLAEIRELLLTQATRFFRPGNGEQVIACVRNRWYSRSVIAVAVERRLADSLAAAARRAGYEACRLVVITDGGHRVPLPSARAGERRGPGPRALGVLAVAILLAAATRGVLMRMVADQERVMTALAPAVHALSALQGELALADAALDSAGLGKTQPATVLNDVFSVARSLPPAAVLNRLEWEAGVVNVAGEGATTTATVAAMRTAGLNVDTSLARPDSGFRLIIRVTRPL